ncbi:MAG: tol-pal system YbgF family protein [Sandaracinaceae bacterium]
MLRHFGAKVRPLVTPRSGILPCLPCLLCLCASVASAQGGCAEATTARARSQCLTQQAQEVFSAGRPDEAVPLLERAYEAYPAPMILYNLGRSHAANGEPRSAVRAYERFLAEDPNGAQRSEVEQLIDEQRSLAVAREQPAPEPDLPRAVASEPVTSRQDGGGLSAGPWVVMGGGALLGGVGAVLSAVAFDRRAEAENTMAFDRASSLRDSANELWLAGQVMFWTAGAALAAGLVWLVIDLTSGDDSSVALQLNPAGAQLRGTF